MNMERAQRRSSRPTGVELAWSAKGAGHEPVQEADAKGHAIFAGRRRRSAASAQAPSRTGRKKAEELGRAGTRPSIFNPR